MGFNSGFKGLSNTFTKFLERGW